jgi:uncharacterized membrane protein HdeD (DUF308 family)
MVVIENVAFPRFAEDFHEHWWTFLIEGIFLVALGFVAVVVPFLAGIVVTVMIGWLLIFVGLFGIWTDWSMRRAHGQGWSFLSSILALLTGAAFFYWPIAGLISLTLILAAYLAIDGAIAIVRARQYRRGKAKNWGWLLVNGILDFFLAGVILVFQPRVSAWLVGFVVGVDLMFAGVALIAMGWAAKRHVPVFKM